MGSNATFVAKERMISNFRTLNFDDGFGYCKKKCCNPLYKMWLVSALRAG